MSCGTNTFATDTHQVDQRGRLLRHETAHSRACHTCNVSSNDGSHRSTTFELLTVESSIEIACSPEDLWDFLIAPESAVLLGDGVVKAFRVPGAPVGTVGDQQCSMYEVDGKVTIHMSEVVEAEAPNRMVVRYATLPGNVLSISTLTPKSAGTTYMSKIGLQVATGTSKDVKALAQKVLADSGVKLKACVESGFRVATPEH